MVRFGSVMDSADRSANISIPELLCLVRAGRLFEIVQRLESGCNNCQIALDAPKRQNVLNEAVATGFHSMVEVLLDRAQWHPDHLATALTTALDLRRGDLARLLLDRGAPVSAVRFYEAAKPMDTALITRLVELGVPVHGPDGFADTVSSMAARPLFGWFRNNVSRYEGLEIEGCRALCKLVERGKKRGIALMKWAGADPMRKFPDLDYRLSSVDGDEYLTSAALEAARCAPLETFDLLKVSPQGGDLAELLYNAKWNEDAGVFDYLLSLVESRSDLNDKANGGSRVVDNFLSASWWWYYHSRETAEKQMALCVDRLERCFKLGANWIPDDDNAVKYVARCIYETTPEHAVRLVRLLRYSPGACDHEQLVKLCRLPKMRGWIGKVDAPLLKEMGLRPAIYKPPNRKRAAWGLV